MSRRYFSILFLFLFLCAALSANAATITVINTNDSGAGSLRQAVIDANTGDDIDFDLPACPCVIQHTAAMAITAKAITINGPGATQLTLDGNGSARFFTLSPTLPQTTALTVSGISFTNGGGPSGGVALTQPGTSLTFFNSAFFNNNTNDGGVFLVVGQTGGGPQGQNNLSLLSSTFTDNSAVSGVGGVINILNGVNVQVTISNSTFTQNSARINGGVISNSGGSIHITNSNLSDNTVSGTPGSNAGAIYINDAGSLIIRGTDINENTASSSAGAINVIDGTVQLDSVNVNGNSLTAPGSGGAINVGLTGSLTGTRVNITGNSVAALGGGGGISINSGTVNLRDSLIATNIANGGGGGVFVTGGNLTLINSTVSGNQTNQAGGGIYSDNAFVTLQNTTIAFNDAAPGDGGGIAASGPSSTIALRATLIAQNTSAANGGPDVYGDVVSQGYNLFGNRNRLTGVVNGFNGDILPAVGVTLDPLLSPLANNGGPTRTHALQAASPAVDKGQAALGVLTDQRGSPRFMDTPTNANRPGGDLSDIGAFELISPTSATLSMTGNVLDTGNRAVRNATVVVINSEGNAWRSITGSLGKYQIDGLEAGKTYVIWVTGTRYEYQPQLVTVNENTQLDLTGEPTMNRKR